MFHVSCNVAHFQQLLFNVAPKVVAFGREAALVVVRERVGDAVVPVGVEHIVVGGLPGFLVVGNVTGPATDVPGVEFSIPRFLLQNAV